VSHLDVADLTQARADDTLALCEKHGVRFSALGYYPNALSADREEAETAREHIRRVIDAAPKLGLRAINTFIGANRRASIDENLEEFARVWPDIIRHAEDRGVRVAIENCPMLFEDSWPAGGNLAQSPVIWRRMFETIPSPHFGLNLDPSHLVMQLIDYLAPIHEFRDKLFHMHAKDMKVDWRRLKEIGTNSPALIGGWGTPKIPGLGDVDWGQWISALTDIEYDGPVCVEMEDRAFEGDLEKRKQALRISRNVLRPLMGSNDE
jgi:sugar phosphate isomerase/epimerase